MNMNGDAGAGSARTLNASWHWWTQGRTGGLHRRLQRGGLALADASLERGRTMEGLLTGRGTRLRW
jgi:hypothetical protein